MSTTNALYCDRALTNILRGFADKQTQMNYIITALGPDRVLRVFRDANAAAKSPAITGKEVINLSMNGAMTLSAGAISGFGFAYKTNIFLSGIDLTTGTAVLRIEGNGHYVQGPIGFGNTFAFSVTSNPDPTHGLAFDTGSILAAPTFKPSGTGPIAPIKVHSSPHTLKLYDWTDPLSPKLVGSSTFATRLPDWVFEHSKMASNHGDASVYQTGAITWDNFSLGGTMMISNPQNTEAGNVPLYEIVVGWKCESAWRSYPRNNTLAREAQVAMPPAFKMTVEDQDGNLMYTWQMHDGSAINDPRLNSGNYHRGGRTGDSALQPKFNTAMMLYYASTRPRKTDWISKIYPGTRNYRDSMAKTQTSLISVEPLLTGGYDGNTANGLADFWYAPQWPLPYAYHDINDPYIDRHMDDSGSSAMYQGWAEGWGHEPGAFGTHNWYTSPGGPRHDRAAINSILAMYLSNPNGNRLQDNTPWRDMIDAFNKNSFNHSNHYLFDPATLQGLPLDEVFSDQWAADGTYYGNYPRDKAVQMCGDQRGDTHPWHYDVEGNMQWDGWGRDPLHDYHNRGWAAMTFCNPLFGMCSKHDVITALMLHQNPFDYGQVRGIYMVRTMAWIWLQVVIGWTNGSQHPLGITQKRIEDWFAKYLESLYYAVYKPVFVDMEDSAFGRGLRNLGLALYDDGGSFTEGHGHLGFYLGHVLQIMKQTGLWYKMIARGTIYETVLKNVIRNMDTYCLNNLADCKGISTNGNYQRMGNISNRNPNGSLSQTDLNTIPTSWSSYYTNSIKGTDWDQADYIHQLMRDNNGAIIRDSNGVARTYIDGNPDVSWNQFEQYARMRKDYFPEITHPNLQPAIDFLNTCETIVTNAVAGVSSIGDKFRSDYVYRYPAVSPFLGPLTPSDLVTS